MFRKNKTEPKAREIVYENTSLGFRMILLAGLALILSIIVELCNRRLSFIALWDFISGNPFYFFFNYLVIITSLIFSELFRRRRATLTAMFILWNVLGIIQFLVLKYRTQPFSSIDVLMLKDAFSLITLYFSWPQIILMFAAGFGVVFLVITIFTRMAQRKFFNRSLCTMVFAGFVLLCFCVCALGTRYGLYPQRFDSLVEAYDSYGFAACFAMTFGQSGISKPDDYSTETVEEILKNIDESNEPEEDPYPAFDETDNLEHPNIVFVQLESLFDVNTVIGGKYSRDPTPTFNSLCKYWPSGELYVPTIGGGTANTEFEVLSGLNLDFFGAGEYPYNTILQEKPCETVCYNLKDYGYKATAMHNNTGIFYSRNEVYTRLGFDRFVPLEYMKDVKYTDLGWAEDGVLTDEILQALRSSPERDMVFTISVESHGKYGETYEPEEGDVEVYSLPEGIPMAPFQNFVNLLPGTDDFLKELVKQMTRFEEPVVLVVYGDHLPALELKADMLSTGNIYASRYVIWNNFGRKFEAPDLQAYRLSANLLKQLNFSGGVITKYHQAADISDNSEEYLAPLEVLEYDMLYGDQEAYNGEYPYKETELQMGSVPVTIKDHSLEYDRLLIHGENFTEYSAIIINDQPIPTAYVDRNTIVALTDGLEFDRFAVAQVTSDGVILSQTEPVSVE